MNGDLASLVQRVETASERVEGATLRGSCRATG